MKGFLKFAGCIALGYAAFTSIILAGFYITPAASLMVFGIEFVAFIKSMDYIYKVNK